METFGITRALSYAILLGGVLTICISLAMVVTSYSSLPYWDGWRQIEVAAHGFNPVTPAWLWAQHNEHRLVLPKLFLAIDLDFFRARQVFLLTSIFAMQLMHLALLSWSMRVLGNWKGDLWRTGTGLAAFCLFCPTQSENFIWGFQVCFLLPLLFTTMSFLALLLYGTDVQQQPDEQPPTALLIISILSALGAAYSLANGNLVWPLLLAATIYLRLRFRVVLTVVAAGALATGLFLYHYFRPAGHANPLASLSEPWKIFNYCTTYFLSSWPYSDTRWRWILWLALAFLFLPVLPYLRKFRPFAIQLVFTMLYCLLTALITAAGRLNFGVSQAAISRYQSVALLFWCCLALLWLGGSFLAHPRFRYWFLVSQLCLLAIFMQAAFRAKDSIATARMHAFAQNTAAAALLSGVSDPQAFRNVVYPEPDVFTVTVPYMRANRLSVFSDSLASKLGRPLDSAFPIADSSACSGALEAVVRVDASLGPDLAPGLRVAGWAWDRRKQKPPSSVIVTSHGTIVGVGATGEPSPQSQTRSFRSGGFTAYAPDLPPGSTANFYAILRGSPESACLIGRLAVN